MNAQLVFQIVSLLCPYMKDIANRTGNKVDDLVVNFLCDAIRGESQVADDVFQILEMLCPFLTAIAERTDNGVDDKVIGFVCSLVKVQD